MAAKAIFKSVCGLTIAIAFTACGGNGIEGEWVEPIPSNSDNHTSNATQILFRVAF